MALAIDKARLSTVSHLKGRCGAFPISYGLREACAPTQAYRVEMHRTSSLGMFNGNPKCSALLTREPVPTFRVYIR
jgi:hypothetical protein